MHKAVLVKAAVVGMLITGTLGSPVLANAQDSLPVDLKAIWSSLTPEEQAAYEQAGRELAARSSAPSLRTPGDTCAGATLEISSLPYNDSNTTVGLTDDVTFGAACGGFNSSSGIGPDIAYVVRTDVTCEVTVEADPAASDLALWVVTDCSDPTGGCVGGDDSGGNGTAEQVSFTATGGVDHYIVVDGFGGASDAFTLSIVENTTTGCSLVPVELQSLQVH